LLGVCLLAASAVAQAARAQDEWPSFENRVTQGAKPDYVLTRSRSIDYYHRRDQPVDKFATLVDGFLDFLDAELIPVSPDRRYKVLLSTTPEEQQQDAHRLFAVAKPTAALGTYYSKYDVVATHAATGPGTITSLLLYPIMREQIPRAPQWAQSAIATFFEKIYGYPADGDRVVVRVGYHNPRRVTEVAGCITRLDLREIIANPDYADGQSHFALAGMFLWQHRKLKTLVERLHDGDLRGQDNALAAAFERPMSEIIPLWQDYLKSVDAAWYGIERTPLSRMFGSIDAFDVALAPVSAHASWSQWFMQRVVLARLVPGSCPIRDHQVSGHQVSTADRAAGR
jgi:hypothetical protein